VLVDPDVQARRGVSLDSMDLHRPPPAPSRLERGPGRSGFDGIWGPDHDVSGRSPDQQFRHPVTIPRATHSSVA